MKVGKKKYYQSILLVRNGGTQQFKDKITEEDCIKLLV